MAVQGILLIFLDYVVNWFLRPLIRLGFSVYYRSTDKLRPLPPIKNDLLLLPATVLAAKIRAKQLTSYEVVGAYIDRIKEIQPLTNCVAATCYDRALEEARNVDSILNDDSIDKISGKYSQEQSPLLGVPFSCKESLWVKDMQNTAGLVARKSFRAPEDNDIVSYLRQAGAILTCLTNTSELCMWFESSNYVTGTTCNPYNLSRMCGGSSGGEGVILSGAGSVIGIGTDIGGSIRLPAYFNGIYGHKVTAEFLPSDKKHPCGVGYQKFLSTAGPMSRFASDLPLLFKVFSGPRYKEVHENFEKLVDLSKLNYYYLDEMPGNNFIINKPTSDVRQALAKAIEFIEFNFHTKVNKFKCDKLENILRMWMSMLNNGKPRNTDFTLALTNGQQHINPFYELARSLLGRQDKYTLPAILKSIRDKIPTSNPEENIQQLMQLKKEINEILGSHSIIICPTFPDTAPYKNEAPFRHTLDFVYCAMFNALGLPVTQIPLGFSETDKLPVGVQLVAGNMCDHLSIRLAEHFEANLVGWVPGF